MITKLFDTVHRGRLGPALRGGRQTNKPVEAVALELEELEELLGVVPHLPLLLVRQGVIGHQLGVDPASCQSQQHSITYYC